MYCKSMKGSLMATTLMPFWRQALRTRRPIRPKLHRETKRQRSVTAAETRENSTLFVKYFDVSSSPIDSNTEVWHGCCLGNVELPGREKQTQNNVRHITTVQYINSKSLLICYGSCGCLTTMTGGKRDGSALTETNCCHGFRRWQVSQVAGDVQWTCAALVYCDQGY